MEIVKKEASNCVLMKANCNDDHYDEVNMAYIELERTELTNWLELRDKLKELKKQGVRELTLDAGMWWIEGIPEELEELYEELEQAEHIEIESCDEFMDKNEMRTESSDAILHDWGVEFKGQLKHTSITASTWSFTWEFVEQALKNCDPQSVRFIKDEEA